MLRWLGCLASAFPGVLVAIALGEAWLDPAAPGAGRWLGGAGALLLVDLALLHASAALGSTMLRAPGGARHAAGVLALAVVYGATGWAFAAVGGSFEIIAVYGWLLGGRLVTVLTAGAEGQASMTPRAALATLCAIALAPAALFVSWAMLAAAYFTLIALSELFVFGPARNAGRAPDEARVAATDAEAARVDQPPEPALALPGSLVGGASSSKRFSEK